MYLGISGVVYRIGVLIQGTGVVRQVSWEKSKQFWIKAFYFIIGLELVFDFEKVLYIQYSADILKEKWCALFPFIRDRVYGSDLCKYQMRYKRAHDCKWHAQPARHCGNPL